MAGFNGCTDAGNVKKTDIVDNLTSTDPTKVLAAPQGKALNDKIANLPVIKTNSFTGTTSGSGNVGKTHTREMIVLSAWTDGSDRIVTPYAGSGAGATGQYTWWFQVSSANSSHSVIANTSVAIYYVYIEMD